MDNLENIKVTSEELINRFNKVYPLFDKQTDIFNTFDKLSVEMFGELFTGEILGGIKYSKSNSSLVVYVLNVNTNTITSYKYKSSTWSNGKELNFIYINIYNINLDYTHMIDLDSIDEEVIRVEGEILDYERVKNKEYPYIYYDTIRQYYPSNTVDSMVTNSIVQQFYETYIK